MDRHHADIEAVWLALPESQRQTLTRDRIALLRWMKAILKARIPHLHDGPATVAACRVATRMFGI
jgi:hypothetical protein